MKTMIILGMLGISALAFASIADDFKDASNRDGYEAIPYSSERSSCSSAGRDESVPLARTLLVLFAT